MRIGIAAGVLLILAVGSAAPAFAQLGANETAVLGGLVSSTLAGRDVDNASRQTGLMGALQFTHPVSTHIGLQTELGLIQKGAYLTFGTATGTGKSQLKLSYLEVPALIRIGFAGKYSEIRPYIFFGPAGSLNVGCKYKVGTGGGGSFESDCDPDGPDISAFDVSAVVGGSIERGNFGIFARYDHGFRTIDGSSAKDDVMNRALIFGLLWNTSSR
jgi:hypothetical protein